MYEIFPVDFAASYAMTRLFARIWPQAPQLTCLTITTTNQPTERGTNGELSVLR